MMQHRRVLVALTAFFWGLTLALPSAHAADTITLATTAWPPHYSPEVEGDGYFSEISREAFRRGGYELEIAFVPWKRAIQGGKDGRYDGVLGLFLTPEREEFFHFTNPVKDVELLLVALKDSKIPDTFSSFDELTNYTVGITRGYAYPEEFLDGGFDLDIADRDEHNLLKLLKRRVDLIADYGDAIYYFINTKYPNYKGKIKSLSPPVDVQIIYNALSKKRALVKKLLQPSIGGWRA